MFFLVFLSSREMCFATDSQDGAISHLNLCLRTFLLSGSEIDGRKADEDAEEVFDDSRTNQPAFQSKTIEEMLKRKTRPNGERRLPKNGFRQNQTKDAKKSNAQDCRQISWSMVPPCGRQILLSWVGYMTCCTHGLKGDEPSGQIYGSI